MKIATRGLGVIAAGVALVVPFASGCSRPAAQARPQTDAPAVAVVKVTRSDLQQTLSLAAEFRPFQEVELFAKVAGYMKAISVDIGDRVTRGQLLAVLEVPELQDEVRQSEAVGRRSEEEMNRAQADVERAEAAHGAAHLSAARLADVVKSRPNLVAQQDIDEAQARDRVAEAQVLTAKAGAAAAREQMRVATASRERAETLVGYSRITAPFAGVVTKRYADVGAMVQAGTASQTQAMPVIRLTDSRHLRLSIEVPESAVSHIHVGEPVEGRAASLNRSFTGTVARLTNRLHADTRTMEAEVDVDNPNFDLIPGMIGDVSIALASVKGVLAVPIQAIDHRGNHASVVVVDAGGRSDVRDVQLGLETSERVEVREGLHEGDLVVTGNRAQLKAGTRVTPKIVAPAAEGETR